MRERPHYRRSHSVREHPRNGRVWLAVAIVAALVVTANVLLVALATPISDMRFSILAILIGIAMNGVLAVVFLIGAWKLWRVSARASVISYVIVSVTLPVVAIIADFLMIFILAAEGYGIIEIQRRMIVGDELRLIVETSRVEGSFMSHTSKEADLKGYFITVDLSSSEPLASRARVYGPLWDVPNPRSSLSGGLAGPQFDKPNADAARATQMYVFDTDGTLLKFTIDPAHKHKPLVREAFVATPDSGSWQRQGEVEAVDDHLEPKSDDRLLTASGRFILLYQVGEARLFDLFTGEPKDDPWLTQCFAQMRSSKDLGNVRQFLTDDLNYLVISPEPWQKAKRQMAKTFEFAGKTFSREDVGLAYSRPDPSPKLFPQKMSQEKMEGPEGAYTIDGNLYLYSLMKDERSLRLYTPDGKKEFRVLRDDAPDKLAWQLSAAFWKIQHAPEKDELIIPDHSSEIRSKDGINATVSMIRWNYKKGTVTRQDTPIIDLFKRSRGQLLPRSPIAVK
jgi:hypothetical protein